MSLPPVLLLGLGRMGGAMAAGWSELGLAPSYAIDPAGHDLPGLYCVPDADSVPPSFAPAAVILAVKPQAAEQAVSALAHYASRAVFLSIMAGRTLAGLGALLGPRSAVVRAMPNTPAAIRQGITVACAGASVSEAQRALCHTLLGAVGSVVWTEEERHLDAVTAISGGGPAYVFLLAELLEQAATAQGLPAELARAIARQTVSGAGALLAASTDDAAELRRAVTSPKGTTERALGVLMAEWPGPMLRAIKAATERSRELAK
jgi:pyrroline-5-carboxylate reductase